VRLESRGLGIGVLNGSSQQFGHVALQAQIIGVSSRLDEPLRGLLPIA
jgi:hypothetical protein